VPGTWLFQFRLRAMQDIIVGTDARIWMDARWFRTSTNSGVDGYVTKCTSGQFVSSGSTVYAFQFNFTEADIKLATGATSSPDIDVFNSSSTTVIDRTNNWIYGLNTGLSSLDLYIKPVGGATLEIIKSSATICGTGTVVNVKNNGVTIKTFQVVIFGDVNGDGNIDAMDAGKIVDFENYQITWAEPSCFRKAGEINGDGSIDSIDAGLIVDCENYLSTIDQVTGTVFP
jgi:hypothetical protein